MKRLLWAVGLLVWFLAIGFIPAGAQELLGGQVFFKGGYARMDDARTDLLVSLSPPEEDAWQIGAGLDIPLMKVLGATLLGEVLVEYVEVSKTTDLTFAVAPGPPGAVDVGAAPDPGKGLENLLHVVVAPKVRIDTLGSIRPWLLPIGLSFNVNSPTNTAVGYLSVGGTTGVGIEFVIAKRFSIGVDFRYYFAPEVANVDIDHFSTGGYVGINF